MGVREPKPQHMMLDWNRLHYRYEATSGSNHYCIEVEDLEANEFSVYYASGPEWPPVGPDWRRIAWFEPHKQDIKDVKAWCFQHSEGLLEDAS